MSTNALSGYNTLLKIGDGGGTEAFVTIAEVDNIRGPNFSLGIEDSTAITDLWEAIVPTVLSAGEVTFDINFLPTHVTHRGVGTWGLLNDMIDRTLRNFQLVFPDSGSTTWAFSAYITGFTPGASRTGKVTAAVTLRISGAPTIS
jgi:hypothetical protein